MAIGLGGGIALGGVAGGLATLLTGRRRAPAAGESATPDMLPPVVDASARVAAARQARARGGTGRPTSTPRALPAAGARTAVLAAGVNLNPTPGVGPFRLY